MNKTKQIVGVGLLTLVGTSFAMAQTPASTSSTYLWQNGKAGLQKMFSGDKTQNAEMRKKMRGNMQDKRHDRKEVRQNIHEQIVVGDFAKFQAAASTTPIGKIDLTTFNNLSAQMKIVKAAQDQIQVILKNAGVTIPGATKM